MSLQNSRAVRGQPLFSRNIRCLKRARKKALHGEQQQDLEPRCGKKHFVPLKKRGQSHQELLTPEHHILVWHGVPQSPPCYHLCFCYLFV